MTKLFSACLLILALFSFPVHVSAQERVPPDTSNLRHTETAGKTYKVHAIIKKIYREEKKITLKHGKIKGYMPAMTMTFPVSKEALFDNLTEGSKGIFTIFVFKGLPTIRGIKMDRPVRQ